MLAKNLKGRATVDAGRLRPAMSGLCPRVSQQARLSQRERLPSPEWDGTRQSKCPPHAHSQGPEADGVAHPHAPLDAGVGLTEAPKPGTSAFPDPAWTACFPSPPNCCNELL